MEKPYRAEFYGSVYESRPRFTEFFEDYDDALEYASEKLSYNVGWHVKFFYGHNQLGTMF